MPGIHATDLDCEPLDKPVVQIAPRMIAGAYVGEWEFERRRVSGHIALALYIKGWRSWHA